MNDQLSGPVFAALCLLFALVGVLIVVYRHRLAKAQKAMLIRMYGRFGERSGRALTPGFLAFFGTGFALFSLFLCGLTLYQFFSTGS